MNPVKALESHGQAVWLDFLARGFVAKGNLKKLIDTDGVKGVTSNPSIFEKAIASSDEYDGAIGQALKSGDRPVAELFEHLAIEDIQHAADVLRPVYEASGGRDGYISLECSPYLANDVVMGILALIHSLCPDNAVAFDYAAPRETLPSWEMLEFDAVSARVRQISEPFRAFFSPQALISDLKAIGFRRVENPTTEELNALYFRHRLDALVLRHELLRMMCAY